MFFTGDSIIRNDSPNPLTLSGNLNASGSVTLTGTGAVVLGGSNSFESFITNAAGVLKVSNAAALSGSPEISIASGTELDTSALGSTGLVLSNGQTLDGNPLVNGNLTIGNGATLAANSISTVMTFSNGLTFNNGAVCSLQLSKSPMTNSLIVALGTVTYGGTLQLTNASATPLAAGDSFTLFSASAYSGAFTNIVPSTPGPGLFWDTSGLATTGTLEVVPGGPLVMNLPRVSGGNVVFTATGGQPNGTFYLMTTTNISLPLAQWTRMATNTFDGSGYFVFTNATGSNGPVRYYRLQAQ